MAKKKNPTNWPGPRGDNYRSSKTGRFVTEDYAKRHPATTVKEHNPPPKKSGK